MLMKRTATVAFVSVALLLVAVVPSQAFPHHHFRPVGARVFVGVGPVWWGPPYPYWYYPPAPVYVVPASVYVTPAPVVIQESPVYVQPQVAPAPPAAAQESFWYYCSSSKAYYPNVQSCPEP